MKITIATLLLAAALPALGEPAAKVALSTEQIQGFGIETAVAEPVDQAVSTSFPAKVTVPNARLRVIG